MLKLVLAAVYMQLCLAIAKGQPFDSYTAEEVPDSTSSNYPACNAGDNSGYVCDPNKLLDQVVLENGTVAGYKALNDEIIKIRGLECNISCPETKCEGIGKHHGPVFSVVIVKSMRLSDDQKTGNESPKDVADQFARRLRRNFKRGDICDEDVLIAVSADQNVFSTAWGEKAKYMSNDTVEEVEDAAAKKFKEKKYTEGLLLMLKSYRNLAEGKPLELENEKEKHWYSPLKLWMVIAIGAVLGLILLLAIGAAVFFFCRKSQGYTMGQRT